MKLTEQQVELLKMALQLGETVIDHSIDVLDGDRNARNEYYKMVEILSGLTKIDLAEVL